MNMSLNEKKCQKQLPDIYLTEGICRSKSFGGLSHRRTNSADATFASSKADVSFHGSLTKSFYSGAALSPNSTLNTSKSLSWSAWIYSIKNSKSSRLNKSPQPERTQIMFDSICKGLRDSIMLVQSEISNSRVAFDNISVSSVTQMKVNERYLKKLEFHLSKLEELKEQYDVQQRIRDGIRAMGYAYILSPGKLKEIALQSVKTEFKESTEVMCTHENNLESLMGTLLFEMIGIQGFARICSGDIFEVAVKHGEQKWKSRGRVIKNGGQIWENKSALFKALFNESLCIKAVEVRGLGKNILLGNKICETRDLFCAHPQQMTINLNPSGSLKLNLIITWHPLNTAQDRFVPSQMSYSIGRNCQSLSLMQESEQFHEFSSTSKQSLLQNSTFFDSSGVTFNEGERSSSLPVNISCDESFNRDHVISHSSSYDATHCSSNCTSQTRESLLSEDPSLNISQTCSLPPNEENSDVYSISSNGQNLTETLKSFLILLSDVPKPCSEILEFTTVLEELNTFLKGKECSTSDSNVSISVESALGCFDFLNSAIDNEEQDTSHDRFPENNDSSLNEESNGTACLTNKMLNLDIDSLAWSSRNEELDTVLTDHLVYCKKLVSSLLSLGPFKCLEDSLLKKLKLQKLYISSVISAISKPSFSLNDFFEEKDSDILNMWVEISENAFYCSAEKFSHEMENVLRAKAVLDNYMASTVSPRLVCDILDSTNFDPSWRVSVFHFKSFFAEHYTPDSLLLEYVADSLATEDLKCQDVQKAFCAVSVLSKIVPSSHSLYQIGCLLVHSSIDLRNIAASYLRAVSRNKDLKQKVLLSYLQLMQSGNASSRLVSCKALEVLEAKQFIKQLSFLMNEDYDINVRDTASTVLSNLAEL